MHSITIRGLSWLPATALQQIYHFNDIDSSGKCVLPLHLLENISLSRDHIHHPHCRFEKQLYIQLLMRPRTHLVCLAISINAYDVHGSVMSEPPSHLDSSRPSISAWCQNPLYSHLHILKSLCSVIQQEVSLHAVMWSSFCVFCTGPAPLGGLNFAGAVRWTADGKLSKLSNPKSAHKGTEACIVYRLLW